MKKIFGAVIQHFNKKNIFSLVALVALVYFFMGYQGVSKEAMGSDIDKNTQVSDIISNMMEKEKPVELTLCNYEEELLWEVSGITVAEALDSSHLIGSKEYPATLCLDGDIATMWQDGEEGNGEGSVLTFRFDEEEVLRYIGIYGGSGKNETSYYENGRIKDITVVIGDTSYEITLDDVMEYQLIQIDGKLRCDEVSITIQSVYEGEVYEDTCVAEVSFYTE